MEPHAKNYSRLEVPADGLVVFIDETGHEEYGDPKFPVFGRGGCALLGKDYKRVIGKPWRDLKRQYLGGALKPFHATTFEASKPTLRQITAINSFVEGPFHRFAVMTDTDTYRPEDVDGHRAVSLMVRSTILKIAARHHHLSKISIVFEESERTDSLVERDFQFFPDAVTDQAGRPVSIDGYFMSKRSLEPGLEIADLIVHTAGRQERKRRTGADGFTLDFKAVFHRSHAKGLVHYMSISKIESSTGGEPVKR